MKRLAERIAVFLLLVAAAPWCAAAKPVRPDTTPPGSLTNANVIPGIRGLAVSFTATGDDGATGTATAYETRIVEGSCAGAAWPAWTSVVGTPFAAGTQDRVYFSPLAAGKTYCMQVRARDDANLYSPNLEIAGATQTGSAGGSWTLTALPSLANSVSDAVVDPTSDTLLMAVHDKSSTSVTQGIRIVRVAPAAAPVPGQSSFGYDNLLAPDVKTPATDDCLLSSVECDVRIPLTDPLFAGKLDMIDSADDDTSPAIALDNGVIGVIVVGKLAGSPRAVLLERRNDGWHSEALIRPAELITGQNVAFVYANGNPIYTWVRVDTTDVSTLVLAERVAGNWMNTDLFARHRASCCYTHNSSPRPPTFQRTLFRDGAGRLKLWVAPDSSGGSNGGVNGVYLVKTLGASSDPVYGIAGCNSPWTYYFSPLLDSGARDYTAALDQSDKLMAVAQPWVSTLQILLVREGAAGQLSAAQCGSTLANAGNMRDTSLTWTNVASDVPSSWTNASAAYGRDGLSSSPMCNGPQILQGVIFGYGHDVEMQLINYDGVSAHTQRVDHVAGDGGRNALQTMANGDQVLIYFNRHRTTAESYFVFARGPASCSP